MTTTTTTTINTTPSSLSRVGAIDGAREDVVVVDAPTGGAGALVWWTLSGTVEYAALTAAWAAAGLPEHDCPSAPTPALALRLAVHAQAGRRRLARRHDGGWVIAAEGRDNAGAYIAHGVLSARLEEPVGAPAVLRVEGDEAAGSAVRAAYEEALRQWPSASLSVWLPNYVRARCAGVAMRDSGGIYYVPPPAVEALQAVRRVLERVSDHRLVLIQALRTDDAVAAILEAITADTEAAVSAALEEADSPLKARRRREVVASLAERLEQYGDLLGGAAQALAERLEEADRTLTLLALAEGAETAAE